MDETDAELVARSIEGDEPAFATLVRRHYRAAYVVALAQTGQADDAEDVCHDAFIRAAERLEHCRDPSRFVHWLCAIVRNHARNANAKQRVRRSAPLSHATAESRNDPSRDVARAELRTRLEAALGQLSEPQREVVLLHDLHGWTHDDIAGVIGTSAGMSRQHLFNARRQLRDILGAQVLTEYLDD